MGDGVPSWVERDFRAYLRCGILAHGFARAPPQRVLGFNQSSGFDPADLEPIPEYEFDQSLAD